jgi:hypothetical protein
MDKKKFEQILDQHTDDWLYDSVEPVRGKHRIVRNGQACDPTGPKRRTLHNGELRENNETGSVQIVTYKVRYTQCQRCDETVADHTETVDLHKQQIKCNTCGQRYAISLLKNGKKTY